MPLGVKETAFRWEGERFDMGFPTINLESFFESKNKPIAMLIKMMLILIIIVIQNIYARVLLIMIS